MAQSFSLQELIEYIERNFQSPQQDLVDAHGDSVFAKFAEGGAGQLVVRLMSEVLYEHISDSDWLADNAEDLNLLWGFLEKHQCLAEAYFGIFQSETVRSDARPLGGGRGGTATTTTTTSSGCPGW